MKKRNLSLLAALLIPSVPAMAQQAPYTVLESGRAFGRLQDAVDAIGAGAGTIRFAAMSYADCAVQKAGDITYRAAIPGQAVFEGKVCEGKAALVLRGRSARVEGLVFAHLKVPDANGAGIRLEHGNLTVTQSWFRDSEEGILAGDDLASAVRIDKSTFTRLGRCDRGLSCAHGIYIGNYGSLTVTNSRFEAGRGGHYVKSRSLKVNLLNNSFDDSLGRDTNYMIDLSNGSSGRIAGNWFVNGRNKENHTTLISVAPEGRQHSAEGLLIEGNTARMAAQMPWPCNFVTDWSGDRVVLGVNQLGPGLKRYERR